MLSPAGNTELHAGDVLIVKGTRGGTNRLEELVT
ncbi:MAG: hypothetical protein ABEI06_09425 [Halobacteriaceae archaeon]